MTSLTVRESEVVAAAREYVETVQEGGPIFRKLEAALAALDTSVGVGEVLAAFRDERNAVRALFSDLDPANQDALLLAWDEARERYCRLLTEYAEAIGLTVRKAEKALGSHLAAFEAMEAAR